MESDEKPMRDIPLIVIRFFGISVKDLSGKRKSPQASFQEADSFGGFPIGERLRFQVMNEGFKQPFL